MKFRYATPEDLTYFSNLLLYAPKENRFLGFTGFERNEFENYRDALTIVLEDKDPIGFIRLRGDKLDAFNAIALLYVAPKYRKNGYGSELIQFGEKYIKAHFQGIGIEVYTNENKPMDSLLKKNKFKFSGQMKYYGKRDGKFYYQNRWIKIYK